MKKQLLIFSLLLGTACTRCSDSKKDQKTIKTLIVHFNYSPDPTTIKGENHPEYLQWEYERRCYKTPEHYDRFSFSYKGDIVDGKLIATVHKKSGDLFEIPLTTSQHFMDKTRLQFRKLRTVAKIPYSGEEIRLEVRRINKEKNVDVLLFEKEIEDLTGSWEEAEGYENIPNGGGFSKASQCHQSMGVR